MRLILINYDVVRPLRVAVIGKIITLLRHENVMIARLAGRCLASAIRYPYSIMGSEPPKNLRHVLSEESAETLERVQDTIKGCIHPIVALAIARSVSWHANFGSGKPAKIARDIFENLPNDIEFRLFATLSDGWGQVFLERKSSIHWQSDLNKWIADVVSDLNVAKPDPSERLACLEQALVTLKGSAEEQSSSHVVVQKLVDDDHFARALIEDALNRRTSLTRAYAGSALGELMRRHKVEGRAYAIQFVEGGDRSLAIAAAIAYAGQQIGEEDKELIKTLLSSSDIEIVCHAIRAVWLWRAEDEGDVLELLLNANLGSNARLINDVAMALCSGHGRLIEVMTEEDAAGFLQHLSSMDELGGYWINEVLSEFSYRFPYVTANFFMGRVELAAQHQSFRMRPANFGPYSQKPLRLWRRVKAYLCLRPSGAGCVKTAIETSIFQYASACMFKAMFPGPGNKLVEFFQQTLPAAGGDDLKLIGRLLREAEYEFVFDHVGFIVELLERCQSIDFELHQEIAGQLYCAAVSGLRSGVPGEPTSRDIADKKKAEDILAGLSRLSPAYELLDRIRKSAVFEIERSKVDAEEFYE